MRMWLWILLVIVAMGLSVPLQRWMDGQRGDAAIIEESLYISSGKTLKRLSLGYHAALADIYWLRAIQYFGSKIPQKGSFAVSNVSVWRLDLLDPLLNLTTELDPNYIQVYRFGGIFLPDLNLERGIAFLKKGIEQNPQAWRLYQDLAYVYWKNKRYQEAGETYQKGSELPGAPPWMKGMQAVMLLRGGDRNTAREIFVRMYQESEDEMSRRFSLTRLQSLQAEDELTFLNGLLNTWRTRTGACPPSLTVLMKGLAPGALEKIKQAGMQFSDSGAPLDPGGTAYQFNSGDCTVALDKESKVVRWKEHH